MDIKLRSFPKQKIFTTAAFILCVVMFIGALSAGAVAIKAATEDEVFSGSVDELILYNHYYESASFQREYQMKLDNILHLIDRFKSEEYIKSGKTISDGRMEDAIRTLFYETTYSYEAYENVDNGYGETRTITIVGQNPSEKYGADFEVPSVRQSFMNDHQEEIARISESLIMDDLRAFRSYQKALKEIEGFSFYATDGVNVVTNLNTTESAIDSKQFTKDPAYFIYENDTLNKVPSSQEIPNTGMKYFDRNLEETLHAHYNEALKVYFSFDEHYLDEKEAAYAEARADILQWVPVVVICALLSLVSLVYLIVTTGRKNKNGEITVYKIDKLLTEIQLFIIGVLFIGGGLTFLNLCLEALRYGVYFGGYYYGFGGSIFVTIFLAAVVGLGSAGIGLAFILSCVRNLKSGRFLKNSVIYNAVYAVWYGVKALYYGGSLMRKVVLITLAICLLSATMVLAPVAAIVILALAPKWVKKFEEIEKGVNEVKSGNLTYKIPLQGEGELDVLAQGINEISEASNKAIQNELKNQRLKTDLISNVSHDLKTPLTSIITYIDLLKKEGLDCEDAPKYLEILDQKSSRLKKLTEDLFDAAKASSGAIPVRFEKVELLSLINQGLGEMGERIEASGLEFKITAEKEKYYVNADGLLLWRVVENLLSNVLKYALEGSRVYLNLKEQAGTNGKASMVILEMKNISKTELNIDSAELMERFKRGDESRTTEGSGLGLAIAKDLVRLQNGWFDIVIDGDLFKAIVMLDTYSDNPEN